MKMSLYILISILFCTGCGTSQNIPISEGKNSEVNIKADIEQIEIDKLDNIYILTRDNRVIRYDSDFNKKYEYSNQLSGDILTIDAANPQKILCFIKDFNRILVLDNTLAEINSIDLSTSEFLDVTAVARSNDDRIWLFDPVTQTLIKINNRTQPQYVSNRLSDYNFQAVEASLLVERDNKVALVDQNLGILVFDNFGQFIKLIPETDVDDIQIWEDYVFYSQYGKFFQYHIKRFEKSKLQEVQGFEKIRITREFYYFYGSKGLIRRSVSE